MSDEGLFEKYDERKLSGFYEIEGAAVVAEELL
jgi:hypothetical protein